VGLQLNRARPTNLPAQQVRHTRTHQNKQGLRALRSSMRSRQHNRGADDARGPASRATVKSTWRAVDNLYSPLEAGLPYSELIQLFVDRGWSHIMLKFEQITRLVCSEKLTRASWIFWRGGGLWCHPKMIAMCTAGRFYTGRAGTRLRGLWLSCSLPTIMAQNAGGRRTSSVRCRTR
jgi:hypothetical protein